MVAIAIPSEWILSAVAYYPNYSRIIRESFVYVLKFSYLSQFEELKNWPKSGGVFLMILEKISDVLERLPKVTSVGIAVLFLTAIYTVADIAIAVFVSGGSSNHAGELLFHSLVILGLGAIVSFIIEVITSIKRVGGSVRDAHDSIKTLIQRADELDESIVQMKKNRHSFETREIGQFVRQHHQEAIGELLRRWHEELEDALSLSLNHRRFTVKEEMQALRSYQIFWQLLVTEQQNLAAEQQNLVSEQQDKKGAKKSLNVLIVHSSSLKIWNDYAIGKLVLGSQRQFFGNGGKSTRILCGQGKIPNSDFIKTAKEMQAHNIEVFYHDIETSKTGFNFRWDFLYVKETKTAVIWKSFGPGASITGSTYQIGESFDGYKLEDLWNIIRNDSKPIEDFLAQEPEKS